MNIIEKNIIGSKIDEARIDGSLGRFTRDLEQFRAMGIGAVELPAHGLDLVINGSLNLKRQAAVLEILKEFRFSYSIHSPNPINLMDKNDAPLHADVLLATLEFARQIKARAVVYHAGRFIPEEAFNIFPVRSLAQKERQELLEQEALLLQSISAQYPDVTIAIENARPYLCQSPYSYGECIDQLKDQVERVNQDNVKINLDFGHLFMTACFYGYDLIEAVKSIRHLVVHTHIHDNFGASVHHWEKQQTHQLPFGKGDAHMPVGWGIIPIKSILDILLPGYKGLLMMELRSRYFDAIPESKENLAALLIP
jgi:sugar phosphate isomerase/epimerase